MSKGSNQRPGTGYSEGWAAIDWSRHNKQCGLCQKPIDKCGCCPTEDGPGQVDEKKED